MNTLGRGEIVARIGRLPALPRVVHLLDAALNDDRVSADAVVRLVASDQGLTVAALRLANASFYGVGGRVVSLRDAVQILGFRTLASVVTTAAVMASFDPAACPGFDMASCWRHALASAVCAQAIAQARGLDDCAAYNCGLLHDVGTLALATHFPDDYGRTLRLRSAEQLTPLEAERRCLGIDHAEVGALIAAHWRFAPVVIGAIRQHHEVPEDPPDPLLDVLHFADNVTHALDLSLEADDMVPPLSLATWDRLGLEQDELQSLFERIEARMQQVGV